MILDSYAADPGRYDGRMPYRTVGSSGLKLPAISLGSAVSYTHLDVYKRQPRRSRSASPRFAASALAPSAVPTWLRLPEADRG